MYKGIIINNPLKWCIINSNDNYVEYEKPYIMAKMMVNIFEKAKISFINDNYEKVLGKSDRRLILDDNIHTPIVKLFIKINDDISLGTGFLFHPNIF